MIGGIGNVPGAVVGALLLGLVEEFVVGYTASQLARRGGLRRSSSSCCSSGRTGCSAASRRRRSERWPRCRAVRLPRAARRLPVLIAVAVLAVLQLAARRARRSSSTSRRIVGVNIILAVSLNIVNGMTGQFSIGHAGFMAVGAYIAGKLSLAAQGHGHLPASRRRSRTRCFFVGSLLAGGAAAALCGFVVGLPSLRLRGDYLAIVTLGFGEIIRVVVQNTEAFGRALGLSGIPQTLEPRSWSGSGSS